MARAKAAQAESVAIELPALDIRTMQITIVGDSALICHAWSAKAKRAMLDKQMKKARQAKEAKSPEDDFRDSPLPSPGRRLRLPSRCLQERCSRSMLVAISQASRRFSAAGRSTLSAIS
jgi:hypothetical protein